MRMPAFALAAALIAAAAPLAAAVPPSILSADGRPAAAIALDASRKPIEMLDFWGIEPGDRVLDMMAGGGYYSELIGRAVGPRGQVLAWNLAQGEGTDSAEYRQGWTALLARQGNVRLIEGDRRALSFPPRSVDAILLHLEYHDFYWESAQYHYTRVEPAAMLAALFSALKPGGTVLVIDHVAEPGGDPRQIADSLHRIDPAIVRADFERAGFVPDGTSDVLMTGQDDHAKAVFDPSVRGRTDRFAYRFRKP